MMNRRSLALNLTRIAGAAMLAGAVSLPAMAADMAPDGMVKQVSSDVLGAIKADKAMQNGDVNRIMGMVDIKLMPHVNFERATASAVGPKWREASPAQRQKLQAEFKTMLVRTYAGAFKMAKDRDIKVLPMRAGAASSNDVLVRSQLVGGSEPTNLDYRLQRTPGNGLGWKVYNISIAGVWQIESYRNQFAPILNTKGIDGLITDLAAQNKKNAGGV